jgi:hypothetical protein
MGAIKGNLYATLPAPILREVPALPTLRRDTCIPRQTAPTNGLKEGQET